MAGTSLDIQVRDLDIDAPLETLRALDRRAVDLTDVMDEIGGALVRSTLMRFERGVSPGGTLWTPSQRAREQGGQTLLEKRRLHDSITHDAGRDNVKVGTNIVYAAIHQFGGTIQREAGRQTIYRRYNERTGKLGTRFVPRKRSNFATDHDVGPYSITMPARPFLGVDEDDERDIHNILADAIRAASPSVEVVR